MPTNVNKDTKGIVSMYSGASELSLFSYRSEKDFNFYTFPYSYSFDLQSSYISQKDYYSKILGILLKDAFSECKIISTGFPAPLITEKADLATDLIDVLVRSDMFNVVLLDNLFLFLFDNFISLFPLASQSDPFSKKHLSNELITYLANLSIYPFVTPKDEADFEMIHQYTRQSSGLITPTVEKDMPILFTGSVFKNVVSEPALYLLMLDILKSKGVFGVYIDYDNKFSVLENLRNYNTNVYEQVMGDFSYLRVGTLVNTNGLTECYLEKEVGTTQFISVKENELFIIPLENDSEARLLLKNEELGTVEQVVRGGELGIIIDTRAKESPNFFDSTFYKKKQGKWKSLLETSIGAQLD